MFLASCSGPAASTPAEAASQDPSARPSSAATPSLEATPARTPEASATPAATPSPSLVAGPATVAVNQLRVRTAPGLSAPPVTFPYADNNAVFDVQLELFEGMPIWLLDEAPVTRDGLEWRQIAVNNILYNDGSILVGWVAKAAADGSAWLVPFSHDCPVIVDANIDQPAFEDLRLMSIVGLACFGGRSLAFVAYWPELPEGAGLGGLCLGPEPRWLLCTNIHYAHVNVTGDTSWAFPVYAPGDGPEALLGQRGQWHLLTGHFDDPAARECETHGELSGEAAELFCRTRFVLESAQPAQKPGS